MKKGNLFFKNKDFFCQYLTKGYFKVSFLSPSQIMQLNEVFYNNFSLGEMPEVYDTIANCPVEVIQKVNNEINEVCEPVLNKIMSNFKIVCSIYFVKKSGENSSLGMHLDPTMTTEKYNNVAIWIPLSDVDRNSGQMCLLPYSQYYLPPYYTSSMPNPYLSLSKDLLGKLHCVDMIKGEALIFNNNIVHQTPKNISGKTRLAVVIKIIDANAPLATVYYNEKEKDNKRVAVYIQDQDFFTSDKFKSKSPVSTSKLLFHVKNMPKKLKISEIKGN